jgi:DNA-binding HxlR family transcriptional regulator
VETARTYAQFCGIARALDLVGERWAMLVVRELVLGPKRFSDLRAGLPGIATNVLTTRLRELEAGGVVSRRFLPPPAASSVYELTEYGRELVPVLLALGRWGARSLGEKKEDEALRSEWLGVALHAYFDSEAAIGVTATIELRLTEGSFAVAIDNGSLTVTAGHDPRADLRIETDELTLVGYLARRGVPEEALRAVGDPDLLRRLPELIPFGVKPQEAASLA